MTYHFSPDAVVERIPVLAGEKLRWQVLSGGLTNRNYRVDTVDKSYVLRLESKHSLSLGLDRALEREVRENAYAAGLGAAIVHAEEGILLSEFLPGVVWRVRDLVYDKKLAALAALLRKVHQLPTCGKLFMPDSVARQYLSGITKESGLLEFADRCQNQLESTKPPETGCCCHNDIVVRNIIQHSGLKLLDWEYACDNDPMFDLASVIGFHDLNAGQVDTLFSAYVGGSDSSKFEQLQEQIQLFDLIQWLWFATRQCSSPDDGVAIRLNELQERIATSYF
jgi:thiamine kinase